MKVPDIKEQRLISRFFAKLNKLISLQQAKCSLLKKQKRGYLQELFPEKGKLIPRLRFSGFNKEWYIYHVRDIFNISRGKVLAKKKISPIKTNIYRYPVYSSSTLNNGLLGYYKKYLCHDALTWTTDGYAGRVKYRKGKFFSTNVNGMLMSSKGYCNNTVAKAINSNTYRYINRNSNPKLMSTTMVEVKIKIPTVAEQQVISRLIDIPNKRILISQIRMKYLRKLKKAYLQKMFC